MSAVFTEGREGDWIVKWGVGDWIVVGEGDCIERGGDRIVVGGGDWIAVRVTNHCLLACVSCFVR